MMETSDLKHLRILIAGGKPHAVATLRTVLGLIGIGKIDAAPSAARALQFLRDRRYDAGFCDESIEDGEGLPFALAARKSPGLVNPMLPLFLVCSAPMRRQVEGARDVGLTDILVLPLSASTVVRKLRQAIAAPRPFIAAGDFFGPDRRSASRSVPYYGSDRRKRIPKKVRLTAEVAAALMGGTASFALTSAKD